MSRTLPFLILVAVSAFLAGRASAEVSRDMAMRAAIHPVSDDSDMEAWLRRVPLTRDFPPDFAETLKGEAPAFIIEASTAPGCIPCADVWAKLGMFRARYGWRIATLSQEDAMLRSGRLGLPWVGDPVVWVRPIADPNRTIPIAVGTDLLPNLARNIYLATKMLTGVRAAVGVRAMAKFTGIVAPMSGAPHAAVR
ncbi:hypothetical protein [Sphingomonas oryzagri]